MGMKKAWYLGGRQGSEVDFFLVHEARLES